MSQAEDGVSRRSQKRGVVFAVGVAIVAALAIVFVLIRGSSSPVGLSSTYTMTFDNLTYDIQTDGSLTDIAEDADGAVHGQMIVGPRLSGTGPITGKFGDGALEFDGAQNGVYTGTLDDDGVLNGTYTYGSQQGTWTATPTDRPATAGGGIPWWLWLAVAAVLIVLVGYLARRRQRR
jgi:hypothetical protein